MRGLVLAIAVLAGCYKPSAEDCSYRCMDGVCPVGLTCDTTNHFCREPGAPGVCSPGDGGGGEGSSCSANLLTDQHNCGVCGRDCGTQQCMSGRCEAEMIRMQLFSPGVLATGYGHVLYVEGTYTNCSAPNSPRVRLMRADTLVDTFTPKNVLDSCPGSGAVGDGYAYTGLFIVNAFAFNGAAAGTGDSTGDFVGGIYPYSNDVYFGTHNETLSVFRAPNTLANPMTVRAIARKVGDLVRTPNAVWVETSHPTNGNDPNRQIEMVTADGQTQTNVITLQQNGALAFGGGRVFFGELGTTNGGTGRLLSSAENTAGPVTPIVGNSEGIIDVAADDLAVYWAQVKAGNAEVWMRRHGTTMDVLVADEQPLIRAIAVEGKHLYWTTDVNDATGEMRRAIVR